MIKICMENIDMKTENTQRNTQLNGANVNETNRD